MIEWDFWKNLIIGPTAILSGILVYMGGRDVARTFIERKFSLVKFPLFYWGSALIIIVVAEGVGEALEPPPFYRFWPYVLGLLMWCVGGFWIAVTEGGVEKPKEDKHDSH